ncbi:PKD domain-containing protein [Flavobacterium caseinilyticum]|uniref:PKD domain-containing protein n=1 Tax=Flavobacterium caseinilyticum TaxID=2541732 RepID=A0A4R5B5T7_9FLAO|nr:hypothetical protein [Flavobacterium caseinilyticum]TDD78572.1 hypothetical protein E0F89_02755 [Flavobacterium caseinilyticum]
MRNTNFYGLFIFSAAMLINSGCTEDTLATGSSTSKPPTVTEPSYPAPNASAGYDIQVILPHDYCWLEGGYYYFNASNNTITNNKVAWEKISGSSTCKLESPDSLKTKVSKLEKGVYEFELTVTNNMGLTGKDRVTVTVGEMSANTKEKIFNDLIWDDWNGWDKLHVEINNFYSHVPSDSFFKVYIQRDNSANWIEVLPWSENAQYYYIVYSDTLFVYPKSINPFDYDTPNVKIIY